MQTKAERNQTKIKAKKKKTKQVNNPHPQEQKKKEIKKSTPALKKHLRNKKKSPRTERKFRYIENLRTWLRRVRSSPQISLLETPTLGLAPCNENSTHICMYL